MKNTFNDLKTKLTEQDIEQIVAIVGNRCSQKTKVRIRSILTYGPSTAGQSYVDEIRTVRNCIVKGG